MKDFDVGLAINSYPISTLFELVTLPGRKGRTKLKWSISVWIDRKRVFEEESESGKSSWRGVMRFPWEKPTANHRLDFVQTWYLRDRREWPALRCFFFVQIDWKRVSRGQSESERVNDKQLREISMLLFTQTSRFNVVRAWYVQDLENVQGSNASYRSRSTFERKGHR